MNGDKLQDRLHLGLGLSARHIGRSADAYRPNGAFRPLDKQNRFIKLPAAFASAKGNGRTNVYGEALWHGIFDAIYTRPGDYLVLSSGIYFIASQEPLLPVLCVQTNRTISITRPNVQMNTASNSYGGYTSGSSVSLIEAWPASVLGEKRSGVSADNLPAHQGSAYWSILLPAVAEVMLLPGDFVTDDLDRTAVIADTELSNLGWRINAKMATT